MSASGLPPDVRGTVATVGTFDGVHLGHQFLLARLTERAREMGLPSLLVTFDPHPLEVVNPAAAPPQLSVGDEKIEVLVESALDYVAVLPFTPALAAFEAAQFVDQILRDRFRVRHLLMGHDHGFGRNRSGNPAVVRALGETRGLSVEVIKPVDGPLGQAISATAIRRAVAGGDLARAAQGLGRPYSVGGRVVAGERRGRLLGFPTINVPLPLGRKLLPPHGVYAVRVQTPMGPYAGMLNLGPRPTFGDAAPSIEVHLFNAAGEFYGMRVRVDFVAKLREIQRFDSPAALVEQLEKDAVAARNALAATD